MACVDVTVVMPARNAAATIGEALAGLARQDTRQRWELVVVDDFSIDGTSRIVSSWSSRIPRLRLEVSPSRGVNCARNTGVAVARGPLIVCCDADDVVAPGWISAMSSALERFDLVGGVLETDDESRSAGRRRLRPVRPTDHLPYAVGASLGFRRCVWEALGGFDESFLIGGDEVDFCWRAQDAGYELGAAADALTYYRSKRGLRPYFVQQYRYQLGSAQLRAKHTALGRLEPVPRSLQLRAIVRRARAVVRVDRLLRRETRRPYLRRVAVFAGSVAGYARFRAVA